MTSDLITIGVILWLFQQEKEMELKQAELNAMLKQQENLQQVRIVYFMSYNVFMQPFMSCDSVCITMSCDSTNNVCLN